MEQEITFEPDDKCNLRRMIRTNDEFLARLSDRLTAGIQFKCMNNLCRHQTASFKANTTPPLSVATFFR